MSSRIKRYKRGIGGFLRSEKGQRFFNFAYSIGAAVVIWGALFKILHLPGGNMLLSIGMGTEVLMFVLSAFDRPPREYNWENVFPVLETKDPEDRPDFSGGNGGGGSVIINGGAPAGGISGEFNGNINVNAAPVAQGEGVAVSGDLAGMTGDYATELAAISEEMRRLRESTARLNSVSETLLESYRAISENSETITRSAVGYVDQMQSLTHNIQGLNTIYEIQLKSIASQLDSIDRVNRGIKDIRDMYEKSAEQSAHYCEETEKMARYMKQLNSVYEKMITAMTINMYNPMMGQAPMPPQQNESQSE
jgi:archaellum component FlaC